MRPSAVSTLTSRPTSPRPHELGERAQHVGEPATRRLLDAQRLHDPVEVGDARRARPTARARRAPGHRATTRARRVPAPRRGAAVPRRRTSGWRGGTCARRRATHRSSPARRAAAPRSAGGACGRRSAARWTRCTRWRSRRRPRGSSSTWRTPTITAATRAAAPVTITYSPTDSGIDAVARAAPSAPPLSTRATALSAKRDAPASTGKCSVTASTGTSRSPNGRSRMSARLCSRSTTALQHADDDEREAAGEQRDEQHRAHRERSGSARSCMDGIRVTRFRATSVVATAAARLRNTLAGTSMPSLARRSANRGRSPVDST